MSELSFPAGALSYYLKFLSLHKQPFITAQSQVISHCTYWVSLHSILGPDGERERRASLHCIPECRERADQQTSIEDDDFSVVNSSQLSAPLSQKFSGAAWKSHPWRDQKLSWISSLCILCPEVTQSSSAQPNAAHAFRIRWWSAGILETVFTLVQRRSNYWHAALRLYLLKVLFSLWSTAQWKAVIVGSQ